MDNSGNLITRIEDAIINTFFEAELMGVDKKLFKLDERNFITNFKKKIVKVINDCMTNDRSITLEAIIRLVATTL